MGLRANTVDGDTGGDPLLDVGDHALCLSVVCAIEVVVVDVELSVRVSSAGGAESDANKVLAKHAAKDAVSKIAILGEDLVHHIPLKDFALVTGNQLGHVVLDDGSQCVAVVNLGDPRRQLRMPEEGVASEELSILRGEIDDGVRIAE